MIKVFLLPVWFSMEFKNGSDGIDVIHTVKAGYNGIGKILDPLLRLYLSDSFEQQLNEHVKDEFMKLGDLLKR